MINQEFTKIFSSRLRAAMSARRVKGIDLAAELDVKPQTITGWRNGQYIPDDAKRAKLCQLLDLQYDDLFGSALSNKVLEEEPSRYASSRSFHIAPHHGSHGYGLPSDEPEPAGSNQPSRADLEMELSYYLNKAEKAGALAVAALAIRKHLDPRDFDYFNKQPKQPKKD